MNVSLVALNYAPSIGGAQHYVRRLGEGLVERGHRVEVLTTDALLSPNAAEPGRIDRPCERLAGVEVWRFPSARRLARTQLIGYRLARRASARLVGTGGAGPYPPLLAGPLSPRLGLAVRRAYATSDVVVGCSAPFLTAVAPPWLRGRRGAATVCLPLLHLGPEPQHRWVAASLRRCDGVTIATQDERRAVVGFGVPEEATAVLPPGSDPPIEPSLAPMGARRRLGMAERPTVGYVGRLAAYKGIDTLVEAMIRLWDQGRQVNLLLAGAAVGGGVDAAVAQARERGGDRFTYQGRFADEERATLLSACEVVAFPSRSESFGLVTVEAWAAGRPVVAAAIPAVSELVTEGVDGHLIPVGDAAALAGAIAGLLDDPVRARCMGAAGRARVEAELSWPVIIDGWEAFLAATVERRRRSIAGTR